MSSSCTRGQCRGHQEQVPPSQGCAETLVWLVCTVESPYHYPGAWLDMFLFSKLVLNPAVSNLVLGHRHLRLCQTSHGASHVTSPGASGRFFNVVLTKGVLTAYCLMEEEDSGKFWILPLTQEFMEPVAACGCLCGASVKAEDACVEPMETVETK